MKKHIIIYKEADTDLKRETVYAKDTIQALTLFNHEKPRATLVSYKKA